MTKLYVTDDELIDRLGVPKEAARQGLRQLDHEHKRNGFPQKSRLWGGEYRYWPKVKQWFDKHNGVTVSEHRRESDAA
jgi:hypothetical protein